MTLWTGLAPFPPKKGSRHEKEGRIWSSEKDTREKERGEGDVNMNMQMDGGRKGEERDRRGSTWWR